MPIEYYLGGFVALVILVLLVSMMRGKRSARRTPTTNAIPSELTQQLTRIANDIEALLVQLKSSAPQTLQPAPPTPQPSPQAIPPREPAQASPAAVQSSAATQQLDQPIQQQATEPKTPEPAVIDAAQRSEPPPPKQHVVLSMFGR